MALSKFEDFVFSKIMVETDIDNCYFYLPNNNCLTYFLNEVIYILKNQEREAIKNNYLIEISKEFYKFLDTDKILKKVDSLEHASLFLLIKSISEGKHNTNNSLIIEQLLAAKRRLSFKCFNKILSEMLLISKQDLFDKDYLSYLVEMFLNEILARGTDIRFIHDSARWYIEDAKFKTFSDYLNFFKDGYTRSTDIKLPIKDCTEKNKLTIQNTEQRISEFDGKFYLDVYDNDTNDYFYIVKTNMTRIDSIFNIVKLYTNSKIDFDFDSEILISIRNQYLISGSLELKINFSKLVTYSGVSPYIKYFENTISNLQKISDFDSDLYHKILNIIGYAEKDNDSINSSSYVDAWIALESLYSLPKINSGFDAVKNMLPKFVSSKIIVSRMTFLLKNSFKKERLSMSDFITSACNNEKLQMTSSNPFYSFELNKLYDCVSNLNKLSDLYLNVENDLRLALLRIYMLRNQYVHESKLSAFTSLDFYKLKNLLTISLDIVFSMVDRKIEYIDTHEDFAFAVFSSIIRKNESRDTLFKINNEYIKCCKNGERMTIRELGDTLSMNDLVLNILLNNNRIIEKFKKYD